MKYEQEDNRIEPLRTQLRKWQRLIKFLPPTDADRDDVKQIECKIEAIEAENVRLEREKTELVEAMGETKKRLENSGVDFDGILDVVDVAMAKYGGEHEV